MSAAAAVVPVAPAIARAEERHEEPGEARSLDGRPPPAYNYSRANKLPKEMTGYWEKHYGHDDGIRYYSESGFRRTDDEIRI